MADEIIDNVDETQIQDSDASQIQETTSTLLGGKDPDSIQSEDAPADSSDAPQTQEPESYDIKLPDSYSEADKASIAELAKELKPSKEQAAALTKYAEKVQENQAKQFSETVNSWESELKKDPDFGGENFDKNIAYAKMAITKLDESGEVLGLLEKSGYGSHPVIVKHFAKIGKMFDEDKLVLGGKSSSSQKTAAQILYPNN